MSTRQPKKVSDSKEMMRAYRRLLSDQDSSDVQVKKRLEYMEALCQNIIRSTLAEHLQAKK
jgi:hypothetical protein